MRVVIPDHLVADEEIAVPKSGVVLRRLGLRLRHYRGAIEVPKILQPVRGEITWLREDGGNELIEMVIDTGEWAVLAQEGLFEDGAEHLAVGQHLNLTGRLMGVAAYEFEHFALPDIRADWLVDSAAQNEETLDWHVDLGPVA